MQRAKIHLTITIMMIILTTLGIFIPANGNNNLGNLENRENISIDATTFVSKWDTTKPHDDGTITNQITLPLTANGMYDFTVDWGDGSSDTITNYNDPAITHTYSTEGTYTVSISGTLIGWQFANAGDVEKIIEISQWGEMAFGETDRQFQGATYLTIPATDAPDLSYTTSLELAFSDCEYLSDEGDMNNWNVSTITNMKEMFFRSEHFNQPLGNWNISNVVNVRGMFKLTHFNQDISAWNVSHLTSLRELFNGAIFFNQDISGWNVSNVIDMSSTFSNAQSFNQDLSPWDVSNVVNMYEMFRYTSKFNHDISGWDVSNVENMGGMFSGASSFNQDISSWDVSTVTNMDWMFSNAYSFNQPLNFQNISSVKNIAFMFSNAKIFNQDLSNWNVSNIVDMGGMFNGAESYNQDLSSWDVSNVLNMRNMFSGATSFNQDLSSWDVSNVEDISGMFAGATSFNQDLSSWNISKVSFIGGIFSGATSFNQDLSSWDVSKISFMRNMFSGATSFNQDLSSWDVSNVEYMDSMFEGATSFNQDLSSWNISNVVQMTRMFADASSFNQSLHLWNITNVKNMDRMFENIELPSEIYDKMLISWSNLNLRQNVRFSAGNSWYSDDAADERAYIQDVFNWIIHDAGQLSTPAEILDLEYNYDANSNSILLVWSQPLTDGGRDILEYRIYRSTEVSSNYKLIGGTQDTEFIDTDITRGETYFYKVFAVNSLGEGELSFRLRVDVPEMGQISSDPALILPVLPSVFALFVLVIGTYRTHKQKK